jgi:HD-GYP domain-containing protein (c-di-GMP phosphodiesterase class II)
MEPMLAKESNFDEKLLGLSSEMDAFEGYTHAHGLRIAAIADAIGKSFNLATHDRFFMQQAALIHDIGEFVMNRDYIKQARELTAGERLDLHRHPVIGEQEAARRGFSRGVQLLVRWHHEWWNGNGYPDALEGEQIPLAARILRVADSFAALRDNRPRRRAMSVAEAKDYLIDWTGLEFDPRVVKAFLTSEYIDFLEVDPPADRPGIATPETPAVDGREPGSLPEGPESESVGSAVDGPRPDPTAPENVTPAISNE